MVPLFSILWTQKKFLIMKWEKNAYCRGKFVILCPVTSIWHEHLFMSGSKQLIYYWNGDRLKFEEFCGKAAKAEKNAKAAQKKEAAKKAKVRRKRVAKKRSVRKAARKRIVRRKVVKKWRNLVAKCWLRKWKTFSLAEKINTCYRA